MKIEINEMNLIYILNSLNHFLRCMEYHYQISDVKQEMKRYINYKNYDFDYNNIITLHRILSLLGNRSYYNIKDDVFFKGQKDYLCTNSKDFKILKNSKRYIKSKEKFINPFRKINLFKLNYYSKKNNKN